MMMTLEQKMARLSPARRKKMEARTAKLIAREMRAGRGGRVHRHGKSGGAMAKAKCGSLAAEARRQSLAAARDEKRKLKGAAGFPVTRKVPNAATRKAIDQLEKGKGKRSASSRALFKDIGI